MISAHIHILKSIGFGRAENSLEKCKIKGFFRKQKLLSV